MVEKNPIKKPPPPKKTTTKNFYYMGTSLIKKYLFSTKTRLPFFLIPLRKPPIALLLERDFPFPSISAADAQELSGMSFLPGSVAPLEKDNFGHLPWPSE